MMSTAAPDSGVFIGANNVLHHRIGARDGRQAARDACALINAAPQKLPEVSRRPMLLAARTACEQAGQSQAERQIAPSLRDNLTGKSASDGVKKAS